MAPAGGLRAVAAPAVPWGRAGGALCGAAGAQRGPELPRARAPPGATSGSLDGQTSKINV